MASAGLSRRVEKVVGYPPSRRWADQQRREFHEAVLAADSFEDLPGGDPQGRGQPAEAARRHQRLARARSRRGRAGRPGSLADLDADVAAAISSPALAGAVMLREAEAKFVLFVQTAVRFRSATDHTEHRGAGSLSMGC